MAGGTPISAPPHSSTTPSAGAIRSSTSARTSTGRISPIFCRKTVIRRVIQHDLLNGTGRRRDAALLEALLRLVCRYAGLAPAVSELAEQVGLSLNMPVDGPAGDPLSRPVGGHAPRQARPAAGRTSAQEPGRSQAVPRRPRAARLLAPGTGPARAGRPRGAPGTDDTGGTPRRERFRLGRLRGRRARHRALARARRRSRGGLRADRRRPARAGRESSISDASIRTATPRAFVRSSRRPRTTPPSAS